MYFYDFLVVLNDNITSLHIECGDATTKFAHTNLRLWISIYLRT